MSSQYQNQEISINATLLSNLQILMHFVSFLTIIFFLAQDPILGHMLHFIVISFYSLI